MLGGRKLGVVVVAALLSWPSVARAQGNVTTALPGSPRCRPSDASPGAPQGGHTEGPPAPVYFARDLPRLTDALWGDRPLGGLGGVRRRARLHHTPVVFVHGNQVDAENWLSVMLQFQNDAGYTMQEMYAVSYDGLENHAAGAPAQHQATAPDEDYVRQNPAALGTAGHGSANDDEVPNLCRFIEAVQWYTGSRQIDVVAHSLGVTIIRKLMVDYPTLGREIVAFVGIAGGNHGTTLCRGLDTSYYGCNEIAPGTAWLAALNRRDAYPPAASMMVFNGTFGDPFFVPPLDQSSPALRGAVDVAFPGQYHNDLRVGPAEVDTYLPFVLSRGQRGPGADRRGRAEAAAITAAQPDGTHGELCGVPSLTGPVSGCPR